MLFGKPKPTVTPEDKDWIEEAFLWLEGEYTSDYLKNVRFYEPTKEFPIDFKGTEQNAEDLTKMICEYMDIKDVQIDLHYFSDKSLELTEGIVTTQNELDLNMRVRTHLGHIRRKGIENTLLELN